MAGSLKTAGINVQREALIADTGMCMAETCLAKMASSGSTAVKYDQFIGELYSGFHAGKISRDAIRRSAEKCGVPSDPGFFALGLNQPDSFESQYARSMRDGVMAAQAETLASLGVAFDHVHYESDEIAHCESLLDNLRSTETQRGWLSTQRLRLDNGHIISLYDAPNVPSENLLLLSYVYRQLLVSEYDVIVPIAGREWRNHLSGYATLLGNAFPSLRSDRYSPLYTGHVTHRGQKLSSKIGPMILVDSTYEALLADIGEKFPLLDNHAMASVDGEYSGEGAISCCTYSRRHGCRG